jgi:predicted NBD/HSP70 family sugar kinase
VDHHEIDSVLVRAAVDLLDEAKTVSGHAGQRMSAVVLGVPAPVPQACHQRRAHPGAPGRPYASPLADQLARALDHGPGVTALVENDANLGALGEATFGAGRGIDTFLYLKLARGVGAGLIVGGRLHRGATGYAGELGHVQVRDDGPLCVCGGRGCLQGILGDALVQTVQPAYERTLTIRDVLELAANGESGPQRVLQDAGRTLGRPLADFASLFNPGAIIVDGSFAPAVGLVIDGIREALDRYAAPVAAGAVSVLAGSLGDDADLLGAAALARLVSLGTP